MKKLYGLIGYPLSHSFSKKYFSDKFQRESISDAEYDLFEIGRIELVEEIFNKKNLRGFNVTIPYKHDIMGYIDSLDHSAKKVGAVNVVKISSDGTKIGYNSDYYGFKISLEKWVLKASKIKALVLGIGGAAKAVMAVLDDLSIPYLKVSRDAIKGDLTYEMLRQQPEIINNHQLIINSTPLGMMPNTEKMPDLPYNQLNESHYLYDLIYNPSNTNFMLQGETRGASTKNGLEMLRLQAEKSWEIWNK